MTKDNAFSFDARNQIAYNPCRRERNGDEENDSVLRMCVYTFCREAGGIGSPGLHTSRRPARAHFHPTTFISLVRFGDT